MSYANLRSRGCDACGERDCQDFDLCDVVLPSHPCPPARDIERAEKQADRLAYKRTASTGACGGKRTAPKWTQDQIDAVWRFRNDGLTYEAAGLLAGLAEDPFRAKNAAVGICRRHPRLVVAS